jgi:uncharacterized phage protein gp47/JayE
MSEDKSVQMSNKSDISNHIMPQASFDELPYYMQQWVVRNTVINQNKSRKRTHNESMEEETSKNDPQ